MSNKSPSFQWYPEKWFADTKRLNWETKGFYFELLNVIWTQFQSTCTIPDDDEFIAGELGSTLEEWQKARSFIMNKHRPILEIQTLGLFSRGLWKEKQKQELRRESSRDNGRKGGRPKTQPKPKALSGLAKTKPRKSFPTPTPTPIHDQEQTPQKGVSSKPKQPPWIEVNGQAVPWSYRQMLINSMGGDSDAAARVMYRAIQAKPKNLAGWIRAGIKQGYASNSHQSEIDAPWKVRKWIDEVFHKKKPANTGIKTIGQIMKGLPT